MVRVVVGRCRLWQLAKVGIEFDLGRAEVDRAYIGQFHLLISPIIMMMKILVLLG